ncbi:imidazolonepropionase [Bailinhaonella thermotolerans]|uniref:Imidazolonepropionase n=1 Tax=Bailinhaonella thermotolerans TaxID=1070861 RepID=A0A3A4AUM9_9ACTN|nr:imidazolonepropionase [Bailinhaonella thermotolerans]RJL32411.1 imidazolonepropionase [Bailinhaonella thermotolerans]
MSSTLFDGIGLLFDGERDRDDGALVIAEGRVAWIGPPRSAPPADERVDVDGRCVIPGFVDSHAHLVFAGDHTAGFAARAPGEPCADPDPAGDPAPCDEPFARPYGERVAATVAATREAGDAELARRTAALVAEMTWQGTTTVEIKSGYGLSVRDEQRSLRVAAGFTTETTYLGAHAVPAGMRPDDYVSLVTGMMLEACAPYARWVDVICDRGAFDGDQTREILRAGMKAGLMPRVHANRFGEGPGVRIACEAGAASADHCTHLTDGDVAALADSGTVATLLPGAEFAARSPYPDARRLLGAGVTVALATGCDPGTSYTSSMPFCVALAVREMRMTPWEALRAATSGGARALRRTDIGRLEVGRRGDLVILDAPSYVHLAYRPGVPLVSEVWRGGRRVA